MEKEQRGKNSGNSLDVSKVGKNDLMETLPMKTLLKTYRIDCL